MKFQTEAQQVSFVEIEMLILQYIWECKGPSIAKKILKNKFGELNTPDIKTSYKTKRIKSFYWYKKRKINQ